jgi:hypothetical protein
MSYPDLKKALDDIIVAYNAKYPVPVIAGV